MAWCLRWIHRPWESSSDSMQHTYWSYKARSRVPGRGTRLLSG
jgi:hypothetical protein